MCVLNCLLKCSMLGGIFLNVKSIILFHVVSFNSFANYVSFSKQKYVHVYYLACLTNLYILSRFNYFLLSISLTDCKNFSSVLLRSIGNCLYAFFENPQEYSILSPASSRWHLGDQTSSTSRLDSLCCKIVVLLVKSSH